MPSPNSLRRVRVIDLETGGNAWDNVCEIGWQDVVEDPDGLWRVDDNRGAVLVNPGRAISTETMAVHHILDEQVANAPLWRDVAPPILQPAGGVVALAAHRASFEQRHCVPRLSAGAKWICTWKGALRLWPELSRFSNQMLRYQRRPAGLVHDIGLPAHRAMPDAYVTAFHLRDMLNTVPAEQLIAWSNEPGLLPRVPSGANRGKSWSELGLEALRALAGDRDIDIRFSADHEIRRRNDFGEPEPEPPLQGRLL